MRVVFLGTPDFAIPSLKALTQKHEVVAVVCQPDRERDRKGNFVFGAVKKQAIEQNARAVADYKNGKNAALRSLIGFIMSKTGGRANAKITEEILVEILSE